MWRIEQNSGIMLLLFTLVLWVKPTDQVGASKEIIVNNPFYLRARIYDSQTANVQFEIPRRKDQRTCRMYQFTISRNNEKPYLMQEQNLTFWRNSLELKHLAAGYYRVCAVICSERMKSIDYNYFQPIYKRNHTLPIMACVTFQAFRPHLLVLTLYILVFLILGLSHIIYSLRKRQFNARIKFALAEIESSIQKWRSTQASLHSTENTPSYAILHNIVTIPASPIDHSIALQPINEEKRPITFHLDISQESPIST